jgi:hypothetical protein
VVSPVPRSTWEAVLASDPGATALQTPEYFAAVLAGTGGRDASRLYVLPDGRRLVLPLVQQRSVPGLTRLADYPGGFGHGSLLATGGLRDTVPPADENGQGGLGFNFQSYNADDFDGALRRCLNLYHNNREGFRALQRAGMEQDFSWNVPAGRYMEQFHRMLGW